MWTPEEQQLFDRCTSLINIADYGQALVVASELSERVKHDPVKSAYAIGCKKAVALHGLGRDTEAEQDFCAAKEMAMQAGAPVIAAYIMNDWSLMFESDTAQTMVRQALALCGKAANSPDPARTIPADIAYFTAVLARHHLRAKHTARAFRVLSQARQSLGRYARAHPRYQGAYLVVLIWERELNRRQPDRNWLRRLSVDCIVMAEVIRQRKLAAAAKLLRTGRLKRLRANVRP